VGAEWFHVDGQTDERTDRHDKTFRSFTKSPKNCQNWEQPHDSWHE